MRRKIALTAMTAAMLSAFGLRAATTVMLPRADYDITEHHYVFGLYPFPACSTEGLEWLPVKIFENFVTITNHYTYNYDEKGRLTNKILVCDQWDSNNVEEHTNYFYDDKDRIIKVSVTYGGNTYDGRLYAYDDKCPDIVISQRSYTGEDDTDCTSGRKSDIERDRDGNITLLTEYEYVYNSLQGSYEWMPRRRCTIDYGGGSLPVSIVEDRYDSYTSEWGNTVTMTDITWYECDGQIFSIEGVISRGNRISSATMSQNGISTLLNVEYPDDDTSVMEAKITGMEQPCTITTEYSFLRIPGSFHRTTTTVTGTDTERQETVKEELIEYDEYGNIIENYDAVTNDGVRTIKKWTRAKISYDMYGRPERYVSERYEPDIDTWKDYAGYKSFDEWIEGAGVKITTDNMTDSDIEYYSIGGLQLTSIPSQGLYIERKRGKGHVMLVPGVK